MADSREWFVLVPDSTGSEFTNLESADRAAKAVAAGGAAGEIPIVRSTSTPVRRYRREVSILFEEINPLV